EHVAFHHLSNGELGGQFCDIREVELSKPVSVPDNMKIIDVEYRFYLIKVMFGVGFQFFLCFYSPGFIFSGRVANLPGEVSKEQVDVMTKCLKLLQFTNNDHVTDVKISARWVDSQFDVEFFPGEKLLFQIFFDKHLDGSAVQKVVYCLQIRFFHSFVSLVSGVSIA